MDHLSELEAQSIYIIREAYARCSNLGMLWSMGKDSTVLLWLCRKAFLGTIPFPVIHIDTSYKLPEIYDFRDRLAKQWQLDLRIVRNEDALAAGAGPKTHDTLACCHALKTVALQQAIAQFQFDGVLLGIRRDEHGVRAKERYFSARSADFSWSVGAQAAEPWDLFADGQGQHDRIHPLLHATELDVWQYVKRENIPVNPLYFSRNGQRYRSIGCAPCCTAITSEADDLDAIIHELQQTQSGERDGRAQDKENSFIMQKLRSLGYM